jgi:M6 family metalloprotease-like protein
MRRRRSHPTPLRARRAGVPVLLASTILLAGSIARADYIDHFATRDDVGAFKAPSHGATRVLVVPVVVDDLPFEQGDERAFLADVNDFFAEGSGSIFDEGFTFTRYFEQASLGRFRPSVGVAPVVRFPRCPPLGSYADCAIPRGAGVGSGDFAGAIAVLNDALDFLNEVLLCATAGPSVERTCTEGGGVDLADFDVSGIDGSADGYVDGVIVVSNAAFPGIALPVQHLATSLLAFTGPHPLFSYDDVSVAAVAIAGRATRPQRQTWVAVHEFGHLLGFADLYNESQTTTDLPYSLMGGWYYNTPASLLDPFSRVAVGWANVVQVAGPGRFALPSSATSGVVLKVGDGDEFFLVEHRQRFPGALDGDLTVDSGVLLQRVRLQKRPEPEPGSYLSTLQSCVNCTAFDSLLMVEEADGRYDLQFGRPRDDDSDLFDAGQGIGPSADTAPRGLAHAVFSTNRLDGETTGIQLEVVAVNEREAVVDVDVPLLADACVVLGDLCVDGCVSDDDGHGRCGDFRAYPSPAAARGTDGDFDYGGGPHCESMSSSTGAGLTAFGVVLMVGRRRRRLPLGGAIWNRARQ